MIVMLNLVMLYYSQLKAILNRWVFTVCLKASWVLGVVMMHSYQYLLECECWPDQGHVLSWLFPTDTTCRPKQIRGVLTFWGTVQAPKWSLAPKWSPIRSWNDPGLEMIPNWTQNDPEVNLEWYGIHRIVDTQRDYPGLLCIVERFY